MWDLNKNVAHLERTTAPDPMLQDFGYLQACQVRQYHASYPEYTRTPLVQLQSLAKEKQVANIYVKDESKRFGLNAFKVLGGSYCIGRYIAKRLALPLEELNFARLMSPEVQEQIKGLTFITATDGNHGRGIAWTANRLKQKSVVYMPKGSAPERLYNIQAAGADASITESNYDDAVRKAYADSVSNGWIVVQDTAWEGYTEIPTWIMQGYTTIGAEIVEQLEEDKLQAPTHIFLQAGVGSMAGAMTAFFADYYAQSERKPTIIIVEPEEADCILRTAKANDGTLHKVTGSMPTMMAGLACGEPCSIAWELLKKHADYYISIPDSFAATGMRTLGRPVGTDTKVVSGESGASCFGLVVELLSNPELAKVKELFNINSESCILCISTEGDTDKANYRKIVEGEI